MNLLEILKSNGLSIAAAESVTAGRVQSLISSTSGISEFFRGGITAYTIDNKVELLGVERGAAAKVDCVSAEVAEQMARGVTELFRCDIGISTTGYADANPDNGREAPCAFWAVWDARKKTFLGRGYLATKPDLSRTDAQEQIAQAVYAVLYACLKLR